MIKNCPEKAFAQFTVKIFRKNICQAAQIFYFLSCLPQTWINVQRCVSPPAVWSPSWASSQDFKKFFRALLRWPPLLFLPLLDSCSGCLFDVVFWQHFLSATTLWLTRDQDQDLSCSFVFFVRVFTTMLIHLPLCLCIYHFVNIFTTLLMYLPICLCI